MITDDVGQISSDILLSDLDKSKCTPTRKKWLYQCFPFQRKRRKPSWICLFIHFHEHIRPSASAAVWTFKISVILTTETRYIRFYGSSASEGRFGREPVVAPAGRYITTVTLRGHKSPGYGGWVGDVRCFVATRDRKIYYLIRSSWSGGKGKPHFHRQRLTPVGSISGNHSPAAPVHASI